VSFPFSAAIVEIVEMEMKQPETRYVNNFFGFLDLENVGVGTKLVFLACIGREIWPFYTIFTMATGNGKQLCGNYSLAYGFG
jgi:hypothetical protein